MDQEPDAPGKGAGYWNLRRVEQCHDIPAEILGGAGGEGGVEVPGDREEGAHDIIGMKIVGLDDRTQQLVGGGQDLRGVVALDRRGATNTMDARVGGVGHGR